MEKNLNYEEILKEKQKFLKFLDPEGFRINNQLDYNYSQTRNDLLKKIYKEYAAMAPDFIRKDAQYLLTTNEWKLYEVTVGQILRHTSKIYDGLRNSPSWRQGPFGADTVEYGIYNDMRPAKFMDRFRNLNDDDVLSISTGTQKAYGPAKVVYLDMDIVASARRVGRPIVEDHAREAAALVGHKEEMYLALGTGHYAWPTDEKIGGASGMTGLFNKSGANSIGNTGGIGNDDDLTAAGDFVNTVGKMRSKLVEDKYYGENGYLLLTTPGIITQLAINSNATRGTTEWETVREYLADSGVKFKLIETKYIGEASAALASSSQEMCLIDPNPRGLELIETYPLGQKLELHAEKPQDLKFAIVGRSALIIKDANCICITTALTTTNAY